MRPVDDLLSQHIARDLRRNPTESERELWYRLRRKQVAGVRFRRQVPMGPYVADFACLSRRLIIELDGGQHATALQYDAVRAAYLQRLGFRVLRFWNHEVLANMEGVLETIFAAISEDRTSAEGLDPFREEL